MGVVLTEHEHKAHKAAAGSDRHSDAAVSESRKILFMAFIFDGRDVDAAGHFPGAQVSGPMRGSLVATGSSAIVSSQLPSFHVTRSLLLSFRSVR